MLTSYSKTVSYLVSNSLCFILGYYAYIETSWQSANATAVLLSPNVPPTTGKPNNMICFGFWYHMHGQHVDKLNIYMKTGSQLPTVPIWTKAGTQGDRWRFAQIEMTSSVNFMVSCFSIFVCCPVLSSPLLISLCSNHNHKLI